jgi:hypothetical protein
MSVNLGLGESSLGLWGKTIGNRYINRLLEKTKKGLKRP